MRSGRGVTANVVSACSESVAHRAGDRHRTASPPDTPGQGRSWLYGALSGRSDRLYRACFSMCRRTHPRSGRSRSIPPSASPSARAAPAIQDEKCDDDHNEHRHANHQPYFSGDVHLSRIQIPQRPICLRHDRRRPSRARRQEWAYRFLGAALSERLTCSRWRLLLGTALTGV